MQRLILTLVTACFVHGAAAQSVHAVTETSATTKVVNGKVTGPLAEVVELTLRTAGLTDNKISIFPWARAYQLAQVEPNTLIYPIARTAAREAQFRWVGEILKINYYLYKRAERKDIVIRRLADAKPHSIGVLRGDVRQQYLESQGFTHLFYSARWNDNITHVLNGQIDMVALAEFDLTPACREMGVDCSHLEKAYKLDAISSGLYLAYSLSTPDAVVNRTRAAFDKLKAEGKIDQIVSGKF